MKQFQPLAPSTTRRQPLRPRQSSDAGTKKFRPLVARSSTPPRPPGTRVGAVAAVTSRFLTGGAVARTKYRAPVLARRRRRRRGAAVARDARAGRAADAADGAACNDARRRHAQRVRRAAPRARRPPGAARAPASARRVAQNVVRRRPAAVGGAWAAGASVSGGDVTTAILRAHSARYYASLEAATARDGRSASDQRRKSNSPRRHRRDSGRLAHRSSSAQVELTPAGDTMGCGESLLAARAAVAISIEAVRAARRVPCAACLVRPPGHHVARDGKTAVAPSQGFCLLNSVAVAALEASANGFEKVAVVDVDVHHGNGTEDIFSGDDRLFFASVHAFGGGTYPGTGGARTKSAANVLNVPLPPPIKKSGFRRAVEKIARRVKAFGPDLLLLSAGFDGHRDDLADLGRLDEEDYGRCTRTLLASCGCPCVSILEGGYGRDCEGDDGVARETGAGLAAAIDDQRLRSFDACLEAHLDACADHFHGTDVATPPTPPEPASPLAVVRRLSEELEEE